MVQSMRVRQMAPPKRRPPRLSRPARPLSVDLPHRPNRDDLWRLTLKSEDEDIIDLGAPRTVLAAPCLVGPPTRVRRGYTPNPRLYPGPKKPHKLRKSQKSQILFKQKRKATVRKNVYRRPLPNSRLYRPAPPRPPPPPANPRTVWQPRAPGKLETASHVAFRLNQRLWATSKPSLEDKTVRTLLEAKPDKTAKPKRPVRRKRYSSPVPSPKVVIKLPAAAGDGNPSEGPRYRPASRHFRDRELCSRDSTPTGGRVITLTTRGNMDATPRHSTSPEDCSEGNDSAPSEFLAEFLSAIMRRQYAEALKYCRLILQYEPRNATARGFYPLLQQKVQHPREPDKLAPRARHQRQSLSRASRSPDLEF